VIARTALVLLAGLALAGCGSEKETTVTAMPSTTTTAAPVETAPEQAVIVYLKAADLETVEEIEPLLESAIAAARVGEYDGNAVAVDGSEAMLYAYGPDADALWRVMEPIVAATSPRPGSYVVKRYGEAGDPSAREVRVEL
jgi:hypothetical protein